MFEGYNNIKEMVFAFSKGKLTYANQAAQYFFNSYMYLLIGGAMDSFFDENALSSIEDKLSGSEDFEARIALCNGREVDFSIRHKLDDYGRDNLLFVELNKEKNHAENILRAAAVPSLYDPLMMGKGDIYITELVSLSDDVLYSLGVLSDSALIQRNKSLYEATQELSEKINRLSSRAKRMIEELTSPESNHVIPASVFSLNDLLKTVTGRVNGYVQIENLDIDFKFTSRMEEIMISANYNLIVKAVSGLIYFAILYIRASGRKGRIGVSLKVENDNAVIDITDNGIGLSEDTFKYINEGETDISVISGTKKNEFLNMQAINTFVQQNNGMLFLKNSKEKGSCSTIILPTVSKVYSVLRQDVVNYSIEDEIDRILRYGLIN